MRKPFGGFGLIAAALIMLPVAACSNEPAASVTTEAGTSSGPALYPAANNTGINPDVQLKITFETTPEIHPEGLIEIFDQSTGERVDLIDMSVPFSPNPNGRSSASNEAERRAQARDFEAENFQHVVIDDIYFLYHPVLVNETTAQIDLHPGVLDYGKTYRVSVPASVFGTEDDLSWSFTTKDEGPAADVTSVTVDADGSGDFDTVQGAFDFAPDASETPFEINIRNGRYDELVFLSGKSDIVIRGESRDGVIVGYPNNSAFNPPQPSPSRRPAFSLYNVEDVQLSDFTINNYFIGQAEALMVRGDRVVIDNMQLNGSGDALTTYGSIFMVDSELFGHGDTILGYASLYCLRCTMKTHGPFTWTRTPEGQHGNVFVDSTFINLNAPLPWTVTEDNPEGRTVAAPLARLPRNGPGSSAPNFPFAEMVLINAKTQDLMPEGWGPVQEPDESFNWDHINFAEFNTMDMDGNPVDLSERHPIVKILTLPEDAEIIDNYSTPEFVLGGWSPVVH